jgi:hypothetical protein
MMQAMPVLDALMAAGARVALESKTQTLVPLSPLTNAERIEVRGCV